MINRTHKLFSAAPCLSLIITLVVFTGCDPGAVLPGLILPADSDTGTFAQQVLDLTNAERAKEGLADLVWNDQLAQAAVNHAQDMIDRGYFSHFSPEGDSVGDRATAAGYAWWMIGENIAEGQKTPQEVVEAWMNSPEHQANILRADFTDLGVGARASIMGRYRWVQVFGRELSEAP